MTDTAPNADTATAKRPGNVKHGYTSARQTAGRAARSARDAAGQALDRTQAAVRDAGRRAAQRIEENPIAVLAGGAALGIIAAAALPRSDREKELLAPVGKRLAETATGAAHAAKEAGKAELVSVGFGAGAASDRVGKVVRGVLQVLTAAGEAAAGSTSKSGRR